MPVQTLPPLARKYHREQRTAIDVAIDEVMQRWMQMGPRFNAGWSLVGPTIAAIIADSQRKIAKRADAYIPAILAATDQARYVPAVAESNIQELVGLTGAGLPVYESLSVATIRAKQAVAENLTPVQALESAGTWLSMATSTILADTMRSAESIGRYTRNVGYVRMVNGGACGRCVVLAGKHFKTNQGFLRHPRCRCTHIPANENIAGDWQTEPRAYFDSLTPEQQVKLMGGKANAQAVIDGADMGRLINAYRPNAGMRLAQMGSVRVVDGMKFSNRESVAVFFGTKRSATTGRRLREVSVSTPRRLMPETIAQLAKDDADRIRLLKRHGWIVDHDFETLSPGDKAALLWRNRNDPLF